MGYYKQVPRTERIAKMNHNPYNRHARNLVLCVIILIVIAIVQGVMWLWELVR